MKKVLLVDDEILIRETIRDCIHWENEGFIYCGDASDGEVALPMIEELHPDILITDIKMPFMNGLELCTIVRQRMPDIKIIILSGHGEFEYARSALSIGIEEYCLKPISSVDLIQLLRSVSRKIDKERSEKAQIDHLRQSENENKAISREKLLGDLCSGFLTTTEALHSAALLAVPLISRYYAVVVMDLRYTEEREVSSENLMAAAKPPLEQAITLNAEDRTLLKQANAYDDGTVLAFQQSRTKTGWIVKGDTIDALQERIKPFRKLQDSMAEQDGSSCAISIGIGSIQDRLQGVHVSFLEAEEDMHWRRLSRQNRRNLWEATRSKLYKNIFLDRQAFISFLKVGSPSETPSFIKKFAAVLQPVDWDASLIGYYILNDITLEVIRTAEELYRQPEAPDSFLQPFQSHIESIKTWEDACVYLTRLVEQFWLWRSRSSDRYAHLLVQVKEYIQANFDKDHISLQDAADFVSVSPSHLSKIFSQETGQTFIDFLTQTRIHKAMELLHSTQAKTYEIAFQVGYSDPHYFSNLFKRVTGMTTTEFRKKGTVPAAFCRAEGEPDESSKTVSS
ncbi:response regulator [Paenibacillus bouchesdurhonensis]|uniref:response regulator n=1 Tax=Paenibacillus bouchesdurhonensis TaxID=1870990 RepID=UPI000DA627FE|nr:response regulator [Paenibacillus bouchesdurhonensis]